MGAAFTFWVPPTGVKVWQLRYRHGGKPQTATLGKVSKVQCLAWARAVADKARSRVEAGGHLTRVKAVKKATKHTASANTFWASPLTGLRGRRDGRSGRRPTKTR
jgi:hypothetical protein